MNLRDFRNQLDKLIEGKKIKSKSDNRLEKLVVYHNKYL